MPLQTQCPTLARAYVSDVVPIPRAEQIAMCADVVSAIESVPALEKIYGPGEGDALGRQVQPTEVAVLIRVLALDEPPAPGGIGRGAALAQRLATIEARALYVIDVVAKLRSMDDGWAVHRSAAIRTASRGRKLKTKKARDMQRASVRVRGSIVEQWRALDGTTIHRRVRQHWQDAELTAVEAIETAPEESGKLRQAKESTWRRIFGPRTPTARKRRGAKR